MATGKLKYLVLLVAMMAATMAEPIHEAANAVTQTHILIAGGGAAGWLTAAILAASHNVDQQVLASQPRLQITLVESPDVATVGVGEGTWPSMRQTLKQIGIDEQDFFRCCDASAKQGSQFIDWLAPGTQYVHPFTLPTGWPEHNLAAAWLPNADAFSFGEAVCPQVSLSMQGFAPKLAASGDYQGLLNYGYHLNAGKFIELLRRHCTEKLGVQYLPAHLQQVERAADGSIAALMLQLPNGGHVRKTADLFVDCTGSRSLLLGDALNTPFVSARRFLFNDSALALQVPYTDDATPIASNTRATAQAVGWIWDIGLEQRRGVGQVYASDFISRQQAEDQLMTYVHKTGGNTDGLTARWLTFEPGHRQACWVHNCVAVGMAAGFIEPLEASALALVEWTAKALAASLPVSRDLYPLAAQKMNHTFCRHWQQIISFLKLHYCLSQRDEPYWQAHRDPLSIPDELAQQLRWWQQQLPTHLDFAYQDLLFPAASYQYVMYGMGFRTRLPAQKPSLQQQARQLFQQNFQQYQQLQALLPMNRTLLVQLKGAAAANTAQG